MTQEENSGAGQEFDIDTPLVKVKTKGYHLGNILQVVAGVLLTLIALMIYEMRAETKDMATKIGAVNKEAITALAVATKIEHEKLAVALDKGTEAQQEMNYILTLSPTDRERLNLRMPESLRRRILDR